MRAIFIALLLVATAPGAAQTATQTAAPVAEPDPARLAAATRLVEAVMPPALRDQMIEQTTTTMLANVGKAVMSSPQMAAVFAKEPRARPIFERFIARQGETTRTMMRDMMPAMLVVMARSYARRLTVAQLNEGHDFYATPTGQAYAVAAASVMADPEFAGLMQSTMTKAMAQMPAQAQAMAEELKALGPLNASK
jgi:hypothetical protein